MAIAANQLKVHQMVQSSKEDFSKKTETAMKDATAKAKSAADDVSSKASALQKAVSRDEDTNKSKKGIFSNLLCCKLPSLKIRLPKYKLSFNRKLSFKFNMDLSFSLSICGKEKKVNPLDSVMKLANTIKKNPGLLSPNREDRLNALLKSDILAKMNILGLGATIPTCILDKTIGSMYGSDSGLGPSLRSRNALKTLLYQDPCTAMLANQPLVSKWLSNSTAAAFISTLISSDKEKAFSFVDLALGVLGQRESALGSLASALAYSYDYNTRNKLQLVNQVIGTGKLTGKDYIYMKVNSNQVLKDLDGEKEESDPKTRDPEGDFNKYLDIFNKLDPTWNENNNYHSTTGNKTMTELSNSILLNRYNEINLTGNYTTVLKPEDHIAIINKFNRTVCVCSS